MDQDTQEQAPQTQQPKARGPARLLTQKYVRTLVAGQLGIRVQELNRTHQRGDNGVLPDPAGKAADEALAELLRDVAKELREN